MPLSLDLVITIPLRARHDPSMYSLAPRKLEWAWGLPCGSLESHIQSFDDPLVESLLADDKSVLAIRPDLSRAFTRKQDPYLQEDQLNDIHELYGGQKTFQYVVLHADPACTDIPLYVVSSTIPPHLTLGRSSAKLHANHYVTPYEISEAAQSIAELPRTFSPSRDVPVPLALSLSSMQYNYNVWIHSTPPPWFIDGLPKPPAENKSTPPVKMFLDDERSSASSSRSSRCTASEPRAIPEKGTNKKSKTRDYRPNKRMRRWLGNLPLAEADADADVAFILDDGQDQAEKTFEEQSVAAASLALDQPDYLRVLLKRKRMR
ncbi:hypothetical protein HMN09_00115300 [Mycena chlorophos]|uniref:Uncharacterized protein n=1 Tax=Mycena chlorophos TaxID=658473 RepID=A0A8H6TUP0_MYCCL|nr:hypothetical protein HMN09_00115300 [Mycena chlorophos]